ncbi:MAG: DUF4272 domain-containing protein [Candidatus Methanoplasma sp.]|jgi:hypothetical protein|nr:DUF4272 domain-containing protein [Candidatus Methanoplasma sp.]
MITGGAKRRIRGENARILAEKGYRVCEGLPLIDSPKARRAEEIACRMTVMSILVYAAHRVISPEAAIAWLDANGLYGGLSESEAAALESGSEDDLLPMTWYTECLWALFWLTGNIDDLDPDGGVDDDMMGAFPYPVEDEDCSNICCACVPRPAAELYRMLDLYYNVHWFWVDERVRGRGDMEREGVAFERRRALEWAADRGLDWDGVPMDT